MMVKMMTKMFLTALSLSVCAYFCHAQHYSDATAVLRDRVGNNSEYSTEVRPLVDQSQIINVNFTFSLLAIAEMDDKNQKFVVNGYLLFSWVDEIAAWDLTQYNNVPMIHPLPEQVWRPRVVLFNTLDDRDLFKDDISPLVVSNNGSVVWLPGSLFPMSCKLNMRKFPFDEQDCRITMVSLGWYDTELLFTPVLDSADLANYTESGTWDIESTRIHYWICFIIWLFPDRFQLETKIRILRYEYHHAIIVLSLLNNMVFLIPVESGEKISYGITVLLALSVFMSIVSDMLPTSSDVMPQVTIYILVLLIISSLTVLDSIFIVWLYFHDEKKTQKRNKAKRSFQSVFRRFLHLKNPATAPSNDTMKEVDITTSEYPTMTKTGHSFIDPSSPEADVTTAAFSTNTFPDCPIISRSNVTTSENPQRTEKKSSLFDRVQHRKNSKESEEEKENVNRYKIIGKHIDKLSFVAFMILWFTVTVGFLIDLVI